MLFSTSLLVVAGLLSQASAEPEFVNVEERALKNNCNRDDLYRSFNDPRYSSSASSFCSTYIRPTVKATTTATTTVTVTNGKRELSATTQFPASRLSSACSCILTAAPSPTTVVTTVVATVTTTKASACSVPTPIVQDGGFENRLLVPWQASTYDGREYPYELLSYGLASPGYGGSKQRFYVNDTLASSYNEVDLTQTLTVCPGATYKFTAKYYLTDPGDQSSKIKRQLPPGFKQVYLEVDVDDKVIAASKQSDALGPPIVWKTFSSNFTATSSTALLKIRFYATDFLSVEWGLDNVAVTPA